jgi:hypothetical protein
LDWVFSLKDELLAGKVLSADFYTVLQVRRQLRPTTNRRSIKLLSLSDRRSGEILPDASSLLPCDPSDMLYFEARPRWLLLRGLLFVYLGAGSWLFRGKQVPNALEGDLSLNATSGRLTARV